MQTAETLPMQQRLRPWPMRPGENLLFKAEDRKTDLALLTNIVGQTLFESLVRDALFRSRCDSHRPVGVVIVITRWYVKPCPAPNGIFLADLGGRSSRTDQYRQIRPKSKKKRENLAASFIFRQAVPDHYKRAGFYPLIKMDHVLIDHPETAA